MTEEEQDMLDMLLEVEGGMTDWEIGFVEDMANRPKHWKLSMKQAEKLRQIAERIEEGEG